MQATSSQLPAIIISVLLAVRACAAGPDVHAEAPSAGNTVTVPAGGDFQRALTDAQPGDTIVLAAGAQYVGSFRLPRKTGDDWITIQSGPTGLRELPVPGVRAEPADAAAMAKIVTPSGPALTAEAGAHHYRFVGVEVAPAPGVFVTTLIDLGAARRAEDLAHHLVFERCYIHGDAVKGSGRGIALNSGETTIVDSYFADFKAVGLDTQAIAGWNGPGPFRIVNNLLQAAGESILFGGYDPFIAGLVPSDIEILQNTLSKPVEWRVGDLRYQGRPWTVKTLLELKNARRVRIEGNTLEHNWAEAYDGFAVLFTVRNQEGNAPWSVVEDVSFVNNLVRHVAAGVSILGRDDLQRSEQTKRITIRNNVFLDVTQATGFGRLFQMLNGTADVTIDHNTAFHTEAIVMGGESAPHTGFVFQNNIAFHNLYGIIGSNTGVGIPSLDRYFPGAVVRRNVIIGGNPLLYPRHNFFPSSLKKVKWLDPEEGNYRLAPSSPYQARATDGRNIGADVDGLLRAMVQPPGVAPVRIDPTNPNRAGLDLRTHRH